MTAVTRMRIDVLTLFPRMFESPFAESIVKRARDAGLVDLAIHDIRAWATDRHRVVDDAPYGGGAGMVLKPEPLTQAIRAVKGGDGHVVLMSAQGRLFDQAAAQRLAAVPHLVLVAGHYEGVDERVIEAGSLAHESHTGGLLEGPQYTRPVEHEGRRAPAVLLSGDHQAISSWRRAEAIRRTAERRPDLLAGADLTPEERARLPRSAVRRGAVKDEDLVRAYRSGVGSYRIAARFGISPTTVRSRLRQAGVRLRPARGAQRGPTVAEVKRLRKTGMTVRELARHFGVSHVTIIDRLKKAKAGKPSD